MSFESSAFETLERDFQQVSRALDLNRNTRTRTESRCSAHGSQVLTELVGDKSLERFRQEYEKLHRALKKSHESEKRLIKKCAECLTMSRFPSV